MKKVIAAVGKLGLKNKNQRKEAHSQTDGIIGDTVLTASISGSNPQIPEQTQTSLGTRFFTDLKNNDFTNANITNIYHASDGPSSEVNEITPDMIASATPAAPIVFKGREGLVKQGVNILYQQSPRFLAIVGAGGMGKTSLALHIIKSNLVQEKFQERCYFIPCEIFEDAESLVQGLIHVMKLTMQENKSKHEVLFDHLGAAQGDLLIVFDNFETPWNHGDSRTAVQNVLEKIAQYEKVFLIVTMRGPDGPGDIPWEKLGDQSGIPTLLPIPAKEAFKAFAGDNPQSSDNSESQIDSLLYQLEYVPLAIRLSAQHVKRVPLKALIKMWEKDKISILTEPTKPGRLTSVSFSIELSIQIFRIEGRTLELLSAISFLPDGIPFWVEKLGQMFPEEELSFNVSTLLDSSLIYGQHEGLKMLSPVREHVHSRYPIRQVDIDQLEKFYCLFFEDLPRNTMKAQPIIQLHINNIDKIFRAQISNSHAKESIISAVNTLHMFTRFYSVSMSLIDLILKKDKNIRKDDEVNLKLMKAFQLQWMGEFQDAEAQVISVKEGLNEEGNISQSQADILGRCFYILESIYYPQAQYEKAINMNLQAQKYFKQSENQRAQADSMRWLGSIYLQQNRYKEASEMISEAQQLFQQVGNELGVAECLKKLGDISGRQGRYDEALIGMISDAQKQFETFGNQLRAAECLWSLGEVYTMQEKYDEAIEMTLKAQKQYEEIGYKEGVAECLLTLGCIYMDQEQYDGAADVLSNAQTQYQSFGKIVDVAWCYQRLGITYRSQGQYEKAKEAFTKALELFKEFLGEKYRIGYTLLNFGYLFSDMKDFAQARRKYEEARDIFDSHGQLEKDVDYCSRALAKLDEAEASGSISE
ncbi:TPR-like protein [Dendrothele bispora CBS 962.96]|uniref:TPR-like protein n=1 Tax=Dendrothele bispora (strain CBS 962.96) TaxID=1314807 RepID=A0A4S8KML0_DENBC|nr:TPR-like protein [Dendrothele bispora CBS 962.96]